MHPAFSVIFFTVTAGAGYGLVILLALARIAGIGPSISPDQVSAMGLIALVLITAGLVSSTFHLANPRNAWRSFTRFKTSWLSREAVFAVLFYPVCLLWLIFEWSTGNTVVTGVFAVLTAVIAFIVLICTAMIYGSLKTIRQWHTPLTPVGFVAFALVVGSLMLALMFAHQQLSLERLLPLIVVFLLAGLVVKAIYYYWIGQIAGPSINTALGFTQASLRLLDAGHSGDTFHTQEFGYEVQRARILWLRTASLLLAFLLPLVISIGWFGELSIASLGFACACAYLGMLIERWLFFAEARHTMTLYHGAQRT